MARKINFCGADGDRDEATRKRHMAKRRAARPPGLYFAGWRIARIDAPAIHGYVVHRKQQKAEPTASQPRVGHHPPRSSGGASEQETRPPAATHPEAAGGISAKGFRAGAVRGGAETPSAYAGRAKAECSVVPKASGKFLCRSRELENDRKYAS